MSEFEDIRFYDNSEVPDALRHYLKHPMIKGLLQFTFPDDSFEEIEKKVLSCRSIRDFQTRIIYLSVQRVLEKSSDGLSYSGFDKLDPDQAYLYISNHRDIILDTCLINCVLYETGLKMTASAIGDNLVRKPFLLALSKLNRNFLVKRGLGPREMLKSSQKLSDYIRLLLLEEKRSIWLAQREGRTKDGNDRTQQGVLKMLAMGRGRNELAEYFSKLKIVPVAMSYEFDPTDILKMPELMAKRMEQLYIKSENEDFVSIIKGALGQKGRIHISAGEVLDRKTIDGFLEESLSLNDQLQLLTKKIDKRIYKNYRLWPSNYIACDLLNGNKKYRNNYTFKEKRQFERRISKRVNVKNSLEVNSFLLMYANPVLNQERFYEEEG